MIMAKTKTKKEEKKEAEKQHIYLKSVEFKQDMNPLKAGFKVVFNKQITILVGDNGVGKSTITDAINTTFGKKDDTYLKRNAKDILIVDKITEPFPFKGIDFHSDDKKFAAAFGDDMGLQIQQMKASSGQVTLSLLISANFKELKDGLVVLDEPERGLSIRNQYGLANIILQLVKQKNCQIIMTCHSDIILKAMKEQAQYFDVKLMKDVSYTEYMLSQLIP